MTLWVRVLLWLLPALLVLAVGQFVLVSFFSFQTTQDSKTSPVSTPVLENSDNPAGQLGTVISSKATTETVSPAAQNTSSLPTTKPAPIVRAAPTSTPAISSSSAPVSVPSTSKSAVPITSNLPKKPKLDTPNSFQKPVAVTPKATPKPVPNAPTQAAPVSSSKPAQTAAVSPGEAAKLEVVTPSSPESVAPAVTVPVKAVPSAPSVVTKPVAPVVVAPPETGAPSPSNDNQNNSSDNATKAVEDATTSAAETANSSGTSDALADQVTSESPLPEASTLQKPESQVSPPESSSNGLANPAPPASSPSSEPAPVTSGVAEDVVPAVPPATAQSVAPATPTPAPSPTPVAPSAPENVAPVTSSTPPTAAAQTPSIAPSQPPAQARANSSTPATTAAVPPTPIKPAIVAPNNLDKPVTGSPVKSNPRNTNASTATSSSAASNRPEPDQVKQNTDGFQDSTPQDSTQKAPEPSPQANETPTSGNASVVAPSVPALKPDAPTSTASAQDSAVQTDQLSKLGRLAANGPVLVRQQNGTLEFQTLNNPSGWLLLFSVALLALTLLLGVFGVRRSLAPLYALAREIEHRNAGSLDLIATPPMPELRPAVNALNRLLSELGETLERLKTQEQTAKRFAYNASHELRNPLTAARNYLEVLERHPTQIEATQGALGALDRTERILSSLLQLARLEGQSVPKRERIDLSSFLPAHFDVPVQGQGEVWAERDLLELSLDNLVNNANHHAGGARTIRVEARADGTWLWVEDAGPGFNAELLPKAFEPFAKLGAGTGLGLAIVEAVARVHGGTVRAENRSEGGARVGLSIPAYFVASV